MLAEPPSGLPFLPCVQQSRSAMSQTFLKGGAARFERLQAEGHRLCRSDPVRCPGEKQQPNKERGGRRRSKRADPQAAPVPRGLALLHPPDFLVTEMNHAEQIHCRDSHARPQSISSSTFALQDLAVPGSAIFRCCLANTRRASHWRQKIVFCSSTR